MAMWLLQLWGDLQRCPSHAARGPAAPPNAATLLWCNQSTMPDQLASLQSCGPWASPHGWSPSAQFGLWPAALSEQSSSSY
jgi:hypothetical protein